MEKIDIDNTLRAAGWDGVAPALVVRGAEQRLYLLGGRCTLDGVQSTWPDGPFFGDQTQSWPVSTAAAGFGNRQNSGQTPVGLHRIADCIGAGEPCGMVFKGRVATGEVMVEATQPMGDFITTRILWLEGLEEGLNRGEGCDSHARYIYIHGTPYVSQLGRPGSAGCIRMDNHHILELFERVIPGTLVLIIPDQEG